MREPIKGAQRHSAYVKVAASLALLTTLATRGPHRESEREWGKDQLHNDVDMEGATEGSRNQSKGDSNEM